MDKFGAGREIVSISDDTELQLQHKKILVKEKEAAIKQNMLLKEGLEIQSDRYVLEINKLAKERDKLLGEIKGKKAINVKKSI